MQQFTAMRFLALFPHARRSVPKFVREVQKTSTLADLPAPARTLDRVLLVEGGDVCLAGLGLQ
jgi:hypothetical protein